MLPDENKSPGFPFSKTFPKNTPEPINPINAKIINPSAPKSSAILNVLEAIPFLTPLNPYPI